MIASGDRLPAALVFLADGGEMGERMRAHDWGATRLGEPASWPQPLKTLVGVMLAADQPMFVAWGAERLLLYNDRYAPMLADRHPAAFGRPFMEVWREASENLQPLFDQVFAGEPVHMADIELRLDRPGRPSEAHFAFSYTPVRDDRGMVVGLFCPCRETTDEVLAERHRRAAAERQRAVFQQMPGFVAVMAGPEHRYEYVNDAYVEISGGREFIGRTVREAFPELAGQGFYEFLDEVYATGRPFTARAMPVRLDREDGERFIDFLNEAIRDDHGEITGIFVGGYDVTDQVRAQAKIEAERDRLASVLDNMAEGFALLDRQFVVLDVNAEAMRLETRARDEIVGRTHWEAYPGTEDSELGRLYRDAMARRVKVELDHSYTWADGRETWLEMRAYPVPEGLAVFYRDVSERRKAEDALRATEELNRRILASSADCIKVLDLDNSVEFMSDGGMEVMEVDDFAALHGACWPDFWKGEEHPKVIAALATARGGGTGRFEGFATTMKGSPRWWDVIVTPINGADGRPEKFLSVSRDVTAAKHAEAALRESEEQARLITESAIDYAILTTDAERFVTSWSRGAEAIFLWPEAEIVGQCVDVLFTPEDRAAGAPLQAVAQARETGLAPAERWNIRQDGTRFFARGSVRSMHHADGSLRGFLTVLRDATEQRSIEDALQTSEESLRLANDAAEVGSWDYDLITDSLTWSDRTRAMFGVSPGALCTIGDFYGGLHPEDHDATSAAFATALDPAVRATYDVEYRTVGKEDGIVRWVAARGKALFDDDGRCVRALGTAIDITRRKAAEERQAFLLDLADRLRTLSDPRALMNAAVEAVGRHLSASRVGYGLIEPDGRTVVLESNYVDRVEPLVGTYPVDAFGPGNIANLRTGRTSVYADVEASPDTAGIGLSGFGIAAIVAVPVLRDGALRSVMYVNQDAPREWNASEVGLIEDVAGRLWEAVERGRAQDELRALNATLEQQVADRTRELMATEEQLRQAQKMEAVGQLTGGIAHDFNNLLTGVIGSLDLIQRRLAKGETDRIERYTAVAMTSANRAAALTHRLLAFSRRQPLDPRPVSANQLVTGMEELLRRTIGERTQLEIVTAGGLWQTLCDPNQLESAVLNLAINARDAMPEGGKLTIETCNAHLDTAYAAKSREVRPGQYICICVTDTGVGMTAEVVAKVFEPFFTTKPIGQGTGLGLSMIYGFARQSEGYAKVYSEVDQGTTVKLYLPRFYGESEDAEDVRAELGDEHRAERGEVVLVVEDEQTVRELVVEVLEELGYHAIEAADGPSGLRIVQSPARVDLLVTDIGLPGLNGRQLADAARVERPGLKVLFMTGYAENATIANGFLEPGMQMITKPFAIEALATRIRDMIEAKAG